MSIIYYYSINNDISARLQKILEEAISSDKIESYKSIEELAEKLCRTNRGQSIAILLISAMDEFYEINSIRNLLNDIRIILILPNRSAELISAGYKLHPRFIRYADSDFNEVAIVLKKMVTLIEKKPIITEIPCNRLN